MVRTKTLWIAPAVALSAAGDRVQLPGGLAEALVGPALDFDAVTFDEDGPTYRLAPGEIARLRQSGLARPPIQAQNCGSSIALRA
ncbi:MAG: hypothetical protein FJX35_10380 [Alphaproteobacteria bacterium]|nr:hypothetical protein [Alphaproteobacteria bacterium]